MFFRKRDEVGDADDVDARLDPVVVGRLHGQRHETAVRSADHADASLVEIGLLGDPVEQGADVLDGALAEHAVVELQVGLAVARRAADVGQDQHHAQLVDQVIEPAQEAGTELALGAAVNLDQHRPGAGKAGSGRPIDERGNLAAVEALVVDQDRLGERQRVQAAGLALGPALGRSVRGSTSNGGRHRGRSRGGGRREDARGLVQIEGIRIGRLLG